MNDRIETLMEQAYNLPNSPEKVALIEEAVREADASGDEYQGYNLRMELIEATEFSGSKEKSLVAFAWCLAFYDQHPESFNERGVRSLFWRYKWVLQSVTDFAQVEWSRIEKMQDDMHRRFAEHGYNLRTVHRLRFCNAMRMGNLEQAAESLEMADKITRDDLADCQACEVSKLTEYLWYAGKFEEALENAKPILDGRLSCAEIPHFTYAALIRPAIQLERFDEGDEYAAKGLGLALKNQQFLECIAEYIVYYANRNDLKKAVSSFEKCLAWALETANLLARFRFYAAASALFGKIKHELGETIKLHLPQSFPGHSADGGYDTAALEDWFSQETESLANQFNSRNGNEAFTQYWDETRELAGSREM